MFPEFHAECPFCHRSFESWENAMHQYYLHIIECLDVDDTAARKIARKTIKTQLRDWTERMCEQINQGKEYFG